MIITQCGTAMLLQKGQDPIHANIRRQARDGEQRSWQV